jgi:hypothetical protein
MLFDALNEGALWLLLATFVLSSVEKAIAVKTGSASWHPVMLANARRHRHAEGIMAASLAADLAAVALLAARPAIGAVVSAALIAVYSGAALSAHLQTGDQECRCLWKLLNTSTRAGLLARNAVLLALALSVGLAEPKPSAPGLASGVALLGLLILGVRTVERATRTATRSVA